MGYDSAASLRIGSAVAAAGEGYSLTFTRPGTSFWSSAPPKSRWGFVGEGNLKFEGTEVVLTGKRHRPLPGSPQEIRFPLITAFDVVQAGCALYFEVLPAKGSAIERVRCWFADAATAASIAQRLPTQRSARYQTVADDLVFNQS